ncbi:hypothetical protein DPMN_173131 [Dreissena polymorpha]|uniref:Uncharacterized protein n=1 Tax=Dreissena polymorpha TaxID=45954 RepID=A0A9D4IGN7_DREPO|nr:hypothetical protein DPMN_173131 [Dreissena polymorpha]
MVATPHRHRCRQWRRLRVIPQLWDHLQLQHPKFVSTRATCTSKGTRGEMDASTIASVWTL